MILIKKLLSVILLFGCMMSSQAMPALRLGGAAMRAASMRPAVMAAAATMRLAALTPRPAVAHNKHIRPFTVINNGYDSRKVALRYRDDTIPNVSLSCRHSTISLAARDYRQFEFATPVNVVVAVPFKYSDGEREGDGKVKYEFVGVGNDDDIVITGGYLNNAPKVELIRNGRPTRKKEEERVDEDVKKIRALIDELEKG